MFPMKTTMCYRNKYTIVCEMLQILRTSFSQSKLLIEGDVLSSSIHPTIKIADWVSSVSITSTFDPGPDNITVEVLPYMIMKEQFSRSTASFSLGIDMESNITIISSFIAKIKYWLLMKTE